MRGAATTRRRRTASTEETVTSYMVLTSCPASKLVARSVCPRSLLCSHSPCLLPPSLSFCLSASLYLFGLRHCVAGHCTTLSSVSWLYPPHILYMHLKPTKPRAVCYFESLLFTVFTKCHSKDVSFAESSRLKQIVTQRSCLHALKMCLVSLLWGSFVLTASPQKILLKAESHEQKKKLVCLHYKRYL